MPNQTDGHRAPPVGFVVRASRPGDADAITAVMTLPGVRNGTLRPPFPSADATRRFIEGRSEGDLGLVAERDGLILGSAGLKRHVGRRSHAGEIGMAVHDDHVGQGIGTALLAALVDAADRWLAIRRLELTVFVENAHAIRLYRGFDFEVEGTLRDFAFRDGRYADALAMARIRVTG